MSESLERFAAKQGARAALLKVLGDELAAALRMMAEAHAWGDEEHRARTPGCKCISCRTHAALDAWKATDA